ncbi:hypothetical protein ACFE04_007087 [Oxalis oulophora]
MGDDDDDEMRSSSSSYRVLLISAGASHSVALLCIYKALELRDGGPDYLGKGVLKAEHNVNLIIAPTLIGKHIANPAGNKNLVLTVPAFNEFMILPVGASSFKESMKMDVEVYHHLKAVIKNKYGCCSRVYKYGNLDTFFDVTPLCFYTAYINRVYKYGNSIVVENIDSTL